MDKLEKFKEEIDKLKNLVDEGEVGCASWHMLLHERMKKLCTLYYGYEPSTIKPSWSKND